MSLSSVYVHAPFCARRCFYCDFAVTVRREADPTEWLRGLARELEWHDRAGAVPSRPLDTLFVGGGTPSLLGPSAMTGLRDVLGPDRITPETEWTSEANPESFTPETARAWRAAGLNRISLGVQSFDESVLRWMGRLHGAEGARGAVEVARAAGFDEISVDLIFALPAELERDWRSDLETALALEVPHISLYGLTAESGTPLGRAVKEGRVEMAEQESYAEAYLLAHELLTQAGYDHYEVSNFARPGSQSRHNRVYWDGGDYLGLGNSAHSLVDGRRFWNERDWPTWAALLESGGSPVASEERVDGEERRLEEVWLALRTDRGLPAAAIEGTPVEGLRSLWIREGRALDRPGLALTAEGWLLLDRIAVEVSEALDDGDGMGDAG